VVKGMRARQGGFLPEAKSEASDVVADMEWEHETLLSSGHPL